MQLIQDFEDVAAVNKQLEKMGYNIGIRLIDEFLAKSGTTSCRDLADTAECIAKAAFKMFLGCTADVGGWNADKTAFSLMLYDTPLTEFVELPAQYTGLVYSNILCGVIRGALEMVLMKVRVEGRPWPSSHSSHQPYPHPLAPGGVHDGKRRAERGGGER
ncbi:unnamed protein product [Chrysoparadoxa australica]